MSSSKIPTAAAGAENNANAQHGDEAELARMGYKQELRRGFSMFQVPFVVESRFWT